MKKTAQARNKVWSRNLERGDSEETVGLLVHHRSPQQAAQAIGDAHDAEHVAGGGAVQPPGQGSICGEDRHTGYPEVDQETGNEQQKNGGVAQKHQVAPTQTHYRRDCTRWVSCLNIIKLLSICRLSMFPFLLRGRPVDQHEGKGNGHKASKTEESVRQAKPLQYEM